MNVLTDFDNVIKHLCKIVKQENNGNILIIENGGKVEIPLDLIGNQYEIEEIPNEIEIEKYCYTEEKGFYKNENYVELVDENAELKQVKQELADTQMALAELYEMFIESEV